MSTISITLTAATLDELYTTAALFAASGGVEVDIQDDDNADNNGTPEFDAAGIPWDKRIHTGGANKKNADGTWRRRRNLQDSVYNSVMEELRSRRNSAASAPTAAPPAPAALQTGVNNVMGAPGGAPAPASMQMPPATPAPAGMAAPAAPQPAPAPVTTPVAAPAAPQPAGDGMAFGDFMPKFAQAMHAGRFTSEEMASWLQQWGIGEIGHLSGDPVKTKQFYDWLKAGQRVD